MTDRQFKFKIAQKDEGENMISVSNDTQKEIKPPNMIGNLKVLSQAVAVFTQRLQELKKPTQVSISVELPKQT